MAKKILIVDDDENIQMILEDFLSGRGLHVFKALNGKEALDLVDAEAPDLVLLDMILPGMTGLEVLKGIKKKRPETVVIMLSGFQEENAAKEALAHGAYDYLTKPVSLERLENEFINRILE